MSERKYSVSEIDRMRAVIREVLWRMGGSPVYQMSQAAFSAKLEETLRTYMVNGTDPEELERNPPNLF